MRSEGYSRVVDLVRSIVQSCCGTMVGKNLRRNMVDRRLGMGWKPNEISTFAKIVVKEGIPAWALCGDGLPDILAAVPKELFYCARVGL